MAARWIRAAMQFAEARSILDVGCSLGYVIEGGHRLGLQSAGMDISEYAVRICAERGYRARVGGLESFPFGDGEFDIVIMKHVLEHTPRPKQTLAEVARVLSRNGVVLIAVPDRLYWKGQLLRRSYRYFRPDDLGQQHYVYFTDRSLIQLLETSGFSVRASSKAVYRPKEATGMLRAGYELARYAALAASCSISRTLRLRHELFVIAQRR
jgi:2-polyprenyl-3-methyl-5-hydroxy-6-metoxy-1,4-benzoquinol methylase